MEKNKKINLLDCTFRDGGYYNNWEFKKNDINFYLNNICKTKINYVELGFRFSNKNKYFGPTGYTDDKLINSLKIYKNLKIGVMVNAADLIENNKPNLNKAKKILSNTKKIDFVRVACHFHEIKKIKKILEWLSIKKINLMVNLMQISEMKEKVIIDTIKVLNKYTIKVLYIADSLGSMNPKKINKITNVIRKFWKYDLGFHAHDNLKLAFVNAKSAINANFKYIDSTIMGMGRGAGNLKTEQIYNYLNSNDKSGKNKINLIKKKIFLNLKKKYKWGTNKYYSYAAKNSIHPTYVQELISNKNLKNKDYLNILKSIKKIDAKRFNPNYLSMHDNEKKSTISNIEKKQFKKNVLIIGSSPILIKYKKLIETYIKKNRPTVICVNLNNYIDNKYIDYRVVCHPKRIITSYTYFKKFNSFFILPLSNISKKILNYLKKNRIKILNYGMNIINNNLIVNKKKCILPYNLALGYSLSIAISKDVKNIFLAGFKGFKKDEIINDESEKTIKFFEKKYKNINLFSITPTKFNIKLNKSILK